MQHVPANSTWYQSHQVCSHPHVHLHPKLLGHLYTFPMHLRQPFCLLQVALPMLRLVQEQGSYCWDLATLILMKGFVWADLCAWALGFMLAQHMRQMKEKCSCVRWMLVQSWMFFLFSPKALFGIRGARMSIVSSMKFKTLTESIPCWVQLFSQIYILLWSSSLSSRWIWL